MKNFPKYFIKAFTPSKQAHILALLAPQANLDRGHKEILAINEQIHKVPKEGLQERMDASKGKAPPKPQVKKMRICSFSDRIFSIRHPLLFHNGWSRFHDITFGLCLIFFRHFSDLPFIVQLYKRGGAPNDLFHKGLKAGTARKIYMIFCYILFRPIELHKF